MTQQIDRRAVVAVVLSLVVGISVWGTHPARGRAQDEGSPHRGGTLRVALSNAPTGIFDPARSNDVATAAIVSNIFEGLYKYDEQLRPVPWLAERVEVNSDATLYTFFLRQGVLFHDGTGMDAEAVKFSMDRIRNDRASSRNADANAIADITVLGRYTVQVALNEPTASFPSRLTGGLGAVVSPAAVRSMGDEAFGQNPVGTGPFRFFEYKRGVSVSVARFDGYWRQGADGKPLPYLDKVEWQIVTDPAVRLAALRSGNVDAFAGSTVPRDVDLPIIRADPNLVLMEGPGFGWGGLWLTINKPPFDTRDLRLAVSYALDRQQINDFVFGGSRQIAYGPIPPVLSWAVDPDFRPYEPTADLERARQALADGGRPDGFEFEFWISAGDQGTNLLAEVMRTQLARVGIRMTIQAGDFNRVVIPKLMHSESNAYALGLTGGVDPDQQIANAFETGGGFNFFPYSNPQLDELLRQGRAISDLDARGEIYREAVRVLMADSPYIFTVYGVDRFTARSNVHGGYVGSRATTGYSEFWLDP